jgi:4-amino-4-deoxy-L-arabinose transferase-like glycosyltransferase
MPRIPFWIFLLLGLIYFSAIRVDVMDIDASQYAEVSREMMLKGDYLHVFDRGKDYLDKPPFLFWVSGLSMKVFGVNNFGYRFPSLLFALWALFATYRLAKLLYEENTARMAALILGTCQAMFLITNDVRTDTILMSWVVTALWWLKEWDVSRKKIYFFAGCAAIAFGMMTKGPIALMVPVFCFSFDWMSKRKWKQILQPIFIPGFLLIAAMLLPMCIGLYQQFDLHPEKIIDGHTHTSGIRFFFWTQSFGRLTGESTWSNNAPFSFLFENMLWSFQPWILLFSVALIIRFIQLARQRFLLKEKEEAITVGGFVLTYIVLATSKYQLPHYIFVVFPLAAIMVAKLLHNFFEGHFKAIAFTFSIVQTIISALLFLVSFLLFVYVFKGSWWCNLVWIIGLIVWLNLLLKNKQKVFWLPVVATITANVILTNHFYKTLISDYQASSTLGRFILKQNIPSDKISMYQFQDPASCIHFYAQRLIARNDTLKPIMPEYLITCNAGLDSLQAHQIPYTTLLQGKMFKVSELTPEFINPKTRKNATKNYYLIRCNRANPNSFKSR